MKKASPSSKLAVLGLLTICAAIAVWFLCQPGPPVWRLRTIFRIGSAIDPVAAVKGSPDAKTTIERYLDVIAAISNPVFRDMVVDTSQFEPGSAALSRRLVFNTLRAHALDNNVQDVEIDLTAASAADCLAAYRTIAHQIEQRHASLSDENAKALQAAIDSYKDRSIQLKKWEDEVVLSGNQAAKDPNPAPSNLATEWNETEESLRRLESMKTLLVPTKFLPETDVYVNGPLSNNTVRLSALAGLGLILCTLVLAWGLEIPSFGRRNPST